MSTLLLLGLVLKLAAPLDQAVELDRVGPDVLTSEEAPLKTIWRECLFDRADALAGYARLKPDRAARLAFAGCEEKGRAFRQAARDPARGRRESELANVDQQMRRYALVVARAAATFPAKVNH